MYSCKWRSSQNIDHIYEIIPRRYSSLLRSQSERITVLKRPSSNSFQTRVLIFSTSFFMASYTKYYFLRVQTQHMFSKLSKVSHILAC